MAISLSGPHQVLSLKIGGSEDKFLVLRMTGRESLNRLGEYSVDTVGALMPVIDTPEPVVLETLLGAKAQVTMDVKDYKRYFVGYVTRVDQGERHGRYFRYGFTLRPWLWFATRTRTSRVFQKKSVKEIVDAVLADYGTNPKEWRLVAASMYPKLDYCVQYDETDFDFISRLLQRAGINYFFEYDDDKQTLVFVDSNAKFKDKESNPIKRSAVKWSDSLKNNGSLTDWTSSEEVRFAKAVVKDYDHLATATEIKAEKVFTGVAQKLGKSEVFEYPADVVQNSQLDTASTTTSQAATQRATVVFEALQSMKQVATARCNARDIAVGATFELDGHPRDEAGGLPAQNGHYIVVSANFSAEFADHEAIKDLKSLQRSREGFVAEIVCTSMSGSNVRPEVQTPKPMMRGPQTALVVGASGNEIETDKHGRIKIQFPWDRDGKKDENSSCWVRVGTPWASKNFGAISIPRVGDEVIVDFIDGDPDKPLVVGSIYNDVNPPIWKLPDNATMSGIKSRSSKGRDDDTKANELRFEDKKDSEHVWFQAEKDFYRYVKKKSFEWIGDDETIKVVKNRKESIGKEWDLDVVDNVMHHYGKDMHLSVVGDMFTKGDATWQIKLAKDLSVDVGGDFGYAVKGDTGIKGTGKLLLTSSDEVHIKGGPKIAAEATEISLKGSGGIVIDCSGGVTLKCGGSLVALTSGGVDIVGSIVKINSGGGGGSGASATAASPAKPADAKKLEDINPSKASDYDKNFEDPYKKSS